MTTQINVRIDESLKENVEKIFNNLGITIAEALRIFLKKVETERGIPFSMKCDDYEPNEETKKAIASDDLIELNSVGDIWKQYENN
jgi:DNA-damage-inducible protein J